MKYDLRISRHINAGTTISINLEKLNGARTVEWKWNGGPDEVDPDPREIPAELVNFLMELVLQHMPSPKDPRLEGGTYVLGPDGLKRWISGPINQ